MPYYYITQSTSSKWEKVDHGPYSTKEEAKSSLLALLKEAAQDGELAAIIMNSNIVISAKRIGSGKSIRRDWITVAAKVSSPKNSVEIVSAVQIIRDNFYS